MFLLRVEMPDEPGALGKVATAIASSGADIASVRIVGHTEGGGVVDDFICALPYDVMPDMLVSAFDATVGARVMWISRCPDRWDVASESELISGMVTDSAHARELLLRYGPSLFHCQWAIVTTAPDAQFSFGTEHAPELTPERVAALGPLDELHTVELDDGWAPGWGGMIAAVVPNDRGRVVVMARRGGPEFLQPELRQISVMAALLP